MGLPYHTHDFEVPEASADEVSARLQVSKFITPDKLPEIIEYDPTDFQPIDADLTAIAALTPSNDDVLQRKAGAWTNRTIAQLLTDLGIAAAYQPLDSDLTAIAALTTTAFGRGLLALADAAALRTSAGLTADGQSLVTAANYAAMRALLDLEAGTDFYSKTAADAAFQPLDSDLTSIAALTTTAFGRSLLEAANAAALRTLAGTVIGTDVQAYDAELAAIAGLTSAANKLPYFTGSGTAALTDLSAFARTFLDDADLTALQGTLHYADYADNTAYRLGQGDAHTLTSKGTIVAADEILIGDSAASFAGKVATVTTLTTYLNSLYTGKQGLWIPATAMTTRTTNGAAASTAEMATNKNMFKTLDFDTTTQEFAQFAIRMPKQWNESTVTFAPVWSHAATTTNFGVVFGLAGVAISNDDAGDVAFGTAQTSTDTGGTTNDIYEGPESSAITIAGTPAAGDYVMFQIARNPSDGSDTMAIDARLHGIVLFITTDAGNDA